MPFRKRRRKIESAGPDQEKLAQASAGALGNDATATVARPTFDPLTDEGKSALGQKISCYRYVLLIWSHGLRWLSDDNPRLALSLHLLSQMRRSGLQPLENCAIGSNRMLHR